MSDAIASQTALDPNRPWITDEEELPSRMNWVQTLFNPMGESPKLHFTRAWTALFMAGLLTWVGLGMIVAIVGIAGVDTAGLSAIHNYLIAGMLALTCILSFVIHTRRLNHARKTSLWAIIVLLPLFLGAFAFIGGMSQKAALYQKLYDERTEYLADPAAWQQAKREERQAALAEAAAERARKEAAGETEEGQGSGQRGGRGGPGGQESEYGEGITPDNPLPSKESYILRPNLQAFYMPIVGLNTLIMIWSLTWVARVPTFGREQMARPADPYA